MAIGDRIREARKAAGLSQEGAAKRTSITLKAYGQLERGEVLDPHVSTLTQIADALGVRVVDLMEKPPAGKAPAPAQTGPEGLGEILDRLGAKTRNLADPDLVRDLEGATDAGLMRAVGETRQELELLIPELRRLRDNVGPGDAGFMPTNRALAEATKQVLAFNFFLRARAELEPQEETIALRSLSRRLLDLAVA